MACTTTNEENRYQRAMIDPAFRAEWDRTTEQVARERREVLAAIRTYQSKAIGRVTIPE